MVYIEKLIWNDDNIAHIARHKVTPEEVEEVCQGMHVARQTYDKRLLLIGPTLSGRMIAIILGRTKKRKVYYPVTARPADREEILIYDEESS